MKDCSSLKQDWEKLEKIALTFENPVSFAWHVAGDIIHNGVKITKEVHAGVEDYKAGNWYDFGLQFGEAAAQVFLGKESQDYWVENGKNVEMAKFYQGFLKAFGIEFNLLDLLVCVQYEDQALMGLYVSYLAIESAMHDTRTDDMIGDILGAILGVYAAYQQFETGIPWCEHAAGMKVDFTPATTAMDFVGHPLDNMPVMTRNLMKYEGELKDDVMSAVFYYKTGQFEKFGEFMGNIVKVISEKEAIETIQVAEDNNLFLY